METNIERQFFEVCSFIFAVQQNLLDALIECLPGEIALNSPPKANKKSRPSAVEHIARNVELRPGQTRTRQNQYFYMSDQVPLCRIRSDHVEFVLTVIGYFS